MGDMDVSVANNDATTERGDNQEDKLPSEEYSATWKDVGLLFDLFSLTLFILLIGAIDSVIIGMLVINASSF